MKIKLSKLRQIIREELTPPAGTSLQSRSYAEAVIENEDVQREIRALSFTVTATLAEMMGQGDLGELPTNVSVWIEDALREMIDDEMLEWLESYV